MAQKGGKRKGAGRPRKPLSRRSIEDTGLNKISTITAEEILASAGDEIEAWRGLLTASRTFVDDAGVERSVPDYKIRLTARMYLTDKRDGKAPQSVKVEGGADPVRVLLIGEKAS